MATKAWEELSRADRKTWTTKWESNNANPYTSTHSTAKDYYYTVHPEAKPSFTKKTQTAPEPTTADPTVTQTKQGQKQQVKKLEAKSNPFMDFSTSTYAVSIYLQSPEKYNDMVKSSKKSVVGLPLLIQSGGVNDIDASKNFGADLTYRNKFFNEDFYLDNIQFKSMISGTSVNAPHNHYELAFNVTEPMGLTLLDRLNRAIREYNKGDDNFNFINQQFLMVIRFYGYDEKGRQIGAHNIPAGTTDQPSDPSAFAEKWIPFNLKNITFRLAAEQVVYSIEAIPAVTFAANDKIHGTIPFNLGLQGQSLGSLFNGSNAVKVKDPDAKPPSTPPPAGPTMPEGGIVLSGLDKLLNEYQEGLVKCGIQQVADQYAFDIDPEIASAELIAQGTPLLNRTGMPNGQDNEARIKAVTGKKSQVIKGVKTMSVNAGQKIMTILDLLIRTSSYISDQYKIVVDRNEKEIKYNLQKTDDKPLKWFKITSTTELLKYDCIRNMWGKKITYVVKPYEIQSLSLDALASPDCVVPHKEYQYWFTGKNTEVLNFVQDFNALYYATFGTNQTSPDGGTKNPKRQYNLRTMKGYSVATTQSQQGDQTKQASEHAANAASQLYSPADQGVISLDIVGDPDWIAQSELFYTTAYNNSTKRLMPDRSVNYNHSEIFFALTFNTVVDYDIGTGLADVTKQNYNVGGAPGGVAQYSFLYRANTIVSQLTQGKFIQQLQGTLQMIPEECITGKPKYAETVTQKTETKQVKQKKEAPKQPSKTAGQADKKNPCQPEELKKACAGTTSNTSNTNETEKTAGE